LQSGGSRMQMRGHRADFASDGARNVGRRATRRRADAEVRPYGRRRGCPEVADVGAGEPDGGRAREPAPTAEGRSAATFRRCRLLRSRQRGVQEVDDLLFPEDGGDGQSLGVAGAGNSPDGHVIRRILPDVLRGVAFVGHIAGGDEQHGLR